MSNYPYTLYAQQFHFDFENLHIEPTWDFKIIKRQYRRLVLLNHPDRDNSINASIRLQKIVESYRKFVKYFEEETFQPVEEIMVKACSFCFKNFFYYFVDS